MRENYYYYFADVLDLNDLIHLISIPTIIVCPCFPQEISVCYDQNLSGNALTAGETTF